MAFAAVSPQDRKLNSELRVKFQKLHETLAKQNLLPVIDHLFAEGVISEADEYELRETPNQREQSRKLLSILRTSQHPLAFIKVHEAMMAENAYKPILEQLDELKVCMAEPCSGTAVSEHSLRTELNDYIRGIFPKMGSDEVHQLITHLRSLGVDEMEDMRRLKESHLTGFVKPIRMEKLLEAIAAEQMKPSSQSPAIYQKQKDEQQSAEPTTKTIFPKRKEAKTKVKQLMHEQLKPTAKDERKLRIYQQTVPRVVHTLPGSELVHGVTSLDDQLYVVRCKDTEQVEVYKTTTTAATELYSLVRRLSVPGVEDLYDMTSCKHYRCLYIADSSRINCCVHKVELSGKVTKLSVNIQPESLSVTSQFTVLVTCYDDGKLLELTTEGKQLREIKLQSDIVHPHHAIRLSKGQFVVSHGGYWDGDPVHRVGIVDTNGHVTQSYGGPQGSSSVRHLNAPRHLAVDKDEFIFVADSVNSRVLLLSPTLNFVCEIVSRDQLNGRPVGLSLDVDRRRLYVAVGRRVVVVQL